MTAEKSAHHVGACSNWQPVRRCSVLVVVGDGGGGEGGGRLWAVAMEVVGGSD